jgi:hypothetical protein
MVPLIELTFRLGLWMTMTASVLPLNNSSHPMCYRLCAQHRQLYQW